MRGSTLQKGNLRVALFCLVSAGFTLIELILVLVLASILSVIALGRLSSTEGFAVYGYYQSTLSAVRHAQRQASARNEVIEVAVAGNGLAITCDGDANTAGFQAGAALTNPATGQDWDGTHDPPPEGVSLSGGPIIFDGLGKANTAGSFTITDVDGQSYTITVEGSGYVH